MPGTTMGRSLAALMGYALLAGPAHAQAPTGTPLNRTPAEQVPLPPPRPEEIKEPGLRPPEAKETVPGEPAAKDAAKEVGKEAPAAAE
ncbi:hypothetical protein QR79_31635, partial [Methylobacterium indicum]